MATKKPSRAIKFFGTEAPDGRRRELAAGPITAMFDNGALRYIRYRGVEVLRGTPLGPRTLTLPPFLRMSVPQRRIFSNSSFRFTGSTILKVQ